MNTLLRPRIAFLALGLGIAGLAVPSAANAQYVDLPGTQPHDLDGMTTLDSAQTCGLTCHSSGDPTTPSTMPFDDYIGSMMGNAMRDPLFLAALTVAEQDHAGVGDYCLRCHTPTGFVMGRTRSSMTAALGSDLTSVDREGITCDNCHRMTEPPAGTTLTLPGSAQYFISGDPTRYGPYDTIDSIRHPGAASTFLAESRFCGQCHEIRNPLQPLIAPDGTDTGQRFPLDTTYSEWANSDYATAGNPNAHTCQDCHLPRIAGQGFVATNTTAMLRDMPRRHEFVGANAWALRMLGAMREDFASGEFYDPTMRPYYENGAARAEENLRGAATLEIMNPPTTAHAGDTIEVVARITNRAGHRLPSGYADGRRVWLAVDLVDGAGTVTPVSGRYDDTTAHLDETDTQLHIYRAEHGRAGGIHDGHLALTDRILSDTRIPPAGFHPPAGLEPIGIDYSGGPGGALRNWDDAHYMITIPATATGTINVRVRARYQTTTREYVETLASANHTDTRGSDLLARYEASGRAAPFDMAEATAPIAIAMVTADAGADGGDDASTDAAASDVATDVASDATGGDAGTHDSGTGGGTCACRAAGATTPASRGAETLLMAMAAMAWVVGARRRR